MAKISGCLAIAVFLLLGLAGQVEATPMFDPCITGDCTVLGPYAGNDTESAIAGLVKMPVSQVFKSDPPGSNGNGITVTVASDMFSGTWDSGTFVIDFIVVKAGNAYLVQNYLSGGGGATGGGWSTYGLTGGNNNQVAVSHISFYAKENGGGAVPEPTSILLFGTGLAGLIGWRLRRRNP